MDRKKAVSGAGARKPARPIGAEMGPGSGTAAATRATNRGSARPVASSQQLANQVMEVLQPPRSADLVWTGQATK